MRGGGGCKWAWRVCVCVCVCRWVMNSDFHYPQWGGGNLSLEGCGSGGLGNPKIGLTTNVRII